MNSFFSSLIVSMCLLAAAAGNVLAAPSIFVATNVGLPGVGRGSIMYGDLDNDGKLDLLVTGVNSVFANISQVWRNGGNGTFSNLNASLTGSSSSAVAVGDFDNDGKADFLLTGFTGLDSSHFPVLISQLWQNTGNNTFSNVNIDLPGVDTGAVAWGDYDNDGRLDFVLTGYSSAGAISQIWHNLGNGNFASVTNDLPGVFYSSVAWGDYDNDGYLDLLITGTSNGFVAGNISQVWRNTGNGVFTNINVPLPAVSQGSAAWGDYDNDGKLDILITGYAASGPVSQVWRNTGNGVFTNINAAITGVSQGAAAWGDYDNDGKLDILLAGVDANTNTIAEVWRNTGSNAFTNINAGLAGVSQGSITWVDFDNDGRLDILLSGLDATKNPALTLYKNNTPVKNLAAPEITALNWLTNGVPQISFSGSPGFSYRVYTSTNTTSWDLAGPASSAGAQAFRFSDLQPGNSATRFYRLSKP